VSFERCNKNELNSGHNITTAVIPGGCTKFLQTPDVGTGHLRKKCMNSMISGSPVTKTKNLPKEETWKLHRLR